MTDENQQQDEGPIDKRPEGHRQQACQHRSGEVFTEYGVVDLNTAFPATSKKWKPVYDATERHMVVPFRVVKRGLKTRRGARTIAEKMEEDGGNYRAVLLSDTRGL